VRGETSQVVHASRASMSRFPLVSSLTALRWNQSHAVAALAGSGCSLCAYGTWSVLFYWNSTSLSGSPKPGG